MNRLLTLLLAASCLTAVGQVPDYVPTDGLVAWYPFSGDASDLSDFGNDGSVQGPSLTTDRFGNESCAYGFDGVDDYILIEGSDALEFEDGDFTFSGWFKTLWGKYRKRSKLLQPNQTLYSFRHTGAIEIYKRTGSLTVLQQAMGHASLAVSLGYLRNLEVPMLTVEDMPKFGV